MQMLGHLGRAMGPLSEFGRKGNNRNGMGARYSQRGFTIGLSARLDNEGMHWSGWRSYDGGEDTRGRDCDERGTIFHIESDSVSRQGFRCSKWG